MNADQPAGSTGSSGSGDAGGSRDLHVIIGAGAIGSAIARLLASGLPALVVKSGAAGATVFEGDAAPMKVPGFPVDILNLLGAGDAFASGLIYGRLQGWDWYRSVRMANAVGAIVVTRPACANSMPTLAEVDEFVASRGGL